MTALPSRPFRLLAPLLVLVSAALLCAAPDPIETIGKAATDWVKLRSENARLESDWLAQRQILESTVNALELRAKSAEEKRDNLKAKTAKERDELAAVEARNQATGDGFKAVETRLIEMKDRLIQLRPSLPPRLSAALELPYRSISNPELPSGERLQLTFTILNRCLQFNRLISSGEEVLVLGTEPAPQSLEVIYWGLSCGYALDRAHGKAWFGSPGPQGWTWEARPDAAGSVGRLIAVYNGKADPEMIAVPARLGHLSGESRKN